MTFDLTKIEQSKREFRQRAAALPIEEKLAMLDALRARAITLRQPQSSRGSKLKFGKQETEIEPRGHEGREENSGRMGG